MCLAHGLASFITNKMLSWLLFRNPWKTPHRTLQRRRRESLYKQCCLMLYFVSWTDMFWLFFWVVHGDDSLSFTNYLYRRPNVCLRSVCSFSQQAVTVTLQLTSLKSWAPWHHMSKTPQCLDKFTYFINLHVHVCDGEGKSSACIASVQFPCGEANSSPHFRVPDASCAHGDVSVLPACDHVCLESADPMGLRCGRVRRLKGPHSRDGFACLEMRKTRWAEVQWNTPGTAWQRWIHL